MVLLGWWGGCRQKGEERGEPAGQDSCRRSRRVEGGNRRGVNRARGAGTAAGADPEGI